MNVYGMVVRSTRYRGDPVRDAAEATYFMVVRQNGPRRVEAVQLTPPDPLDPGIYAREGAVIWLSWGPGTAWVLVP